jgi:glutathione S-transferase
MEPNPNHVWVYGNDHSPWVQAVLLGLHEKNIPHTLVTVPPLSVFLESGVLMPAAKIDEGPWLLDSERILVALGFSEVKPDVHSALEGGFFTSAMRRADDPWQFWYRFSSARDEHPVAARRLWNHFWRAFSIFYFFTLIRLGRRQQPATTEERSIEQFSFFQDLIPGDQSFLGGDTPNTVDLQLFGLVQMCASIPVPAIQLLQHEPKLERLRSWISAMQDRFGDYTHLYTATLFEPKRPETKAAGPIERALFWCGAAMMWLTLPISLAITFYLGLRGRKKRVEQRQ